jgi:hypothetical protein
MMWTAAKRLTSSLPTFGSTVKVVGGLFVLDVLRVNLQDAHRANLQMKTWSSGFDNKSPTKTYEVVTWCDPERPNIKLRKGIIRPAPAPIPDSSEFNLFSLPDF